MLLVPAAKLCELPPQCCRQQRLTCSMAASMRASASVSLRLSAAAPVPSTTELAELMPADARACRTEKLQHSVEPEDKPHKSATNRWCALHTTLMLVSCVCCFHTGQAPRMLVSSMSVSASTGQWSTIRSPEVHTTVPAAVHSGIFCGSCCVYTSNGSLKPPLTNI